MKFSVVAWSLCPQMQRDENNVLSREGLAKQLSDTPINLEFIKPMVRRRLSLAGKMVMRVIKDCEDISDWQDSVFCSEHGEHEKVTKLLTSIIEGGLVSPTEFSLSVYNAIAGQYSIISQNAAPFTSIACDEFCIEMAVCEALGRIKSGAQRVMVVNYESGLSERYDDWEVSNDTYPYALAMIISEYGNSENNFEVVPGEYQKCDFNKKHENSKPEIHNLTQLVRLLERKTSSAESIVNDRVMHWKAL